MLADSYKNLEGNGSPQAIVTILTSFQLYICKLFRVIMRTAVFKIIDNVKTHFLKRKKIGLAFIEAALIIPIIIYIVFFTIELVRVHNTKIAMDSMALQCTLDFIATKGTTNFETIIKKHLTLNLKRDKVKYYFKVYNSLADMCADGRAPFGADEIFWPASNTATTGAYMDANNNNVQNSTAAGFINLSDNTNPRTTAALNTEEKLSGKAFVLTFICDFPFSSGFIKKLYGGGVNTKGGARFLLWGRGVGVCD